MDFIAANGNDEANEEWRCRAINVFGK